MVLKLAGKGTDCRFSVHSSTAMSPYFETPSQCSLSVVAIFTGRVRWAPVVSLTARSFLPHGRSDISLLICFCLSVPD